MSNNYIQRHAYDSPQLFREAALEMIKYLEAEITEGIERINDPDCE